MGLVVEVTDDGPANDSLPTLAGARPEAHADRSDVAKGVDREHLGLAVMRERVESIGGRFEIVQRSGRGTTARAILPLEPTDAEEARP